MIIELFILIILIYLIRKSYVQNKKIIRLVQEIGIIKANNKGENK
jgi:hypothetical protein